MAKTIVIGCKLPNGIVLRNPVKGGKDVTINGLHKSLVIGADHVTTEIDGDFWEAWKAKNEEFDPLKSGAIFEARSVNDAAAIAREQTERKTGLEPMKQEAMGVKKANKKDD